MSKIVECQSCETRFDPSLNKKVVEGVTQPCCPNCGGTAVRAPKQETASAAPKKQLLVEG